MKTKTLPIAEKIDSDYLKYRGKCWSFCNKAAEQDPTLTMVRGYYMCPLWGKQAHWWLKDAAGNIVDPTVRQFPTKGIGAEYVEFDGYHDCERCGNRILEKDACMAGHHIYCSDECYMRDVL